MSIVRSAKGVVNAIISFFGYQLTSKDAIPSFERLVHFLGRAQLTPRTIIEVGVAGGTEWFYVPFQSAKYYLFDPTPQSSEAMQELKKRLKADVFNVALGERDATAHLNIRLEHARSSLFVDESEVNITDIIQVPVKRFDALVGRFERPALAKVVAQGAELAILKGMGSRLQELDCIIVQTTLIGTQRGVPEFAEVVSFLAANGFVMYDIIGMIRRPLDNSLTIINMVFVPQGSPLRADRRWHSEPTD